MKKRFLSVLLILALALSLLPTAAIAAGTGSTAEAGTLDELEKALADTSVTTIRFTDHIILGEAGNPETLTIDRDVTFDLNEYGLCYGSDRSTVKITEKGTLRIAPRRNGGYPVVNVVIENHGKLYGGDAMFGKSVDCYNGAEIHGGTFVGDNTSVSFRDQEGTAHIYGGTFGEVRDVGKIILEDGVFHRIGTGADFSSIEGGTFPWYYGEKLREAGFEKLHKVTFQIPESKADIYYVVGDKPLAFQEYSTITEIGKDDKYVTAWRDEATNRRFDFSKPVTTDITLVPVSWETVKGYGITVSKRTVSDDWGLAVTSRNYKDVFGDGTVSYDPESNILTLNNANLSELFVNRDKLNLRLRGKSSIRSNGNYAISARELTVMGPGELEAAGDEAIGYWAIWIQKNGSYTQKSGTVILSGKRACIAGYEPNVYDAQAYTLMLTGGKLICNLKKSQYNDEEYYVDDSNVLDRLTRLEVAEGGKLTFTYENGTTVECQAPTSEEEKQALRDALLGSERVTWLEIVREVEVPDEEEDPVINPAWAGALVLAGDDNPFRDVRAIDWFYGDVMYAYKKGLMGGTAYDRFSPQQTFTRGMLLTILARHDGVNTNGTPWHQAGCDWAVRTGVSDGKNPEEAISREEFAQLLYRYAQYRGSHALAGNDLTGFTDAADISPDALAAMQWAVAQTILRGDNFKLNPKAGATRAEACAMLHRFFER